MVVMSGLEALCIMRGVLQVRLEGFHDGRRIISIVGRQNVTIPIIDMTMILFGNTIGAIHVYERVSLRTATEYTHHVQVMPAPSAQRPGFNDNTSFLSSDIT